MNLQSEPGVDGCFQIERKDRPGGDGAPDIVVDNYYSGRMSVLLNKKPALEEVANDLNGPLIWAYRQLVEYAGAMIHVDDIVEHLSFGVPKARVERDELRTPAAGGLAFAAEHVLDVVLDLGRGEGRLRRSHG